MQFGVLPSATALELEAIMQATEILSGEHRVIEQVLCCLEALGKEAEVAHRLPAESAEQVLEFLRTFADHCHHAKEENHLFPWLERHGFSRQLGPTGVMLREHALGRHYMQQMARSLSGAALGHEADLEAFLHAARAYVQLLREHIRKEDQCLFPMAAQVATPQDDAELVDAYDATESHDIGPGVHAKCLALADALATRFGVQCRPASVAAGCGH